MMQLYPYVLILSKSIDMCMDRKLVSNSMIQPLINYLLECILQHYIALMTHNKPISVHHATQNKISILLDNLLHIKMP